MYLRLIDEMNVTVKSEATSDATSVKRGAEWKIVLPTLETVVELVGLRRYQVGIFSALTC